ncbi:MAG: AEC family transporter [Ruminococcaceae bacterium]|nr:AEC family transporter [Oscillospiraceae bacterium]
MDFAAFLSTVITMFVILIVGFILGKMNIIDSVASKRFSALIVSIAQPALIIDSLISKKYSMEALKLALISLGLAFAVHLIMALIAYLACIKIKDINERKITEFAMVFGNIGFLGIPVMESLFPDNGAFVASFFIVSFNILLWIIGLGILARKRDDIKLTPKKIFINKGTVPTLIGFVIFLLPAFLPSFTLHEVVTSSIGYIASLCTPISMLIIGALLSTRSAKQIFGSSKVYYLCFFKLIAIPLFFCFTLKILGFSDFWVLFITAVSGMPSATATSMFAELYDTAPGFSAQGVGTSTLLSVATMPLVILIASAVIEWNISIF